jgi:hypothetical protein
VHWERGVSAATIALAASCSARAEPRESSFDRREDRQPAVSATPGPEPPARYGPPYWYGWQVLVTDAASVVPLAVGDAGWQWYAWLGTYELGGPLVHAAHGRGWRALGSLGLRVGATLAAVGAAGKCDDRNNRTDCTAAFSRFLVVIYAAAVADAAYDTQDRSRLPASAPPAVAFTLAPHGSGAVVGARWGF